MRLSSIRAGGRTGVSIISSFRATHHDSVSFVISFHLRKMDMMPARLSDVRLNVRDVFLRPAREWRRSSPAELDCHCPIVPCLECRRLGHPCGSLLHSRYWESSLRIEGLQIRCDSSCNLDDRGMYLLAPPASAARPSKASSRVALADNCPVQLPWHRTQRVSIQSVSSTKNVDRKKIREPPLSSQTTAEMTRSPERGRIDH